MTTKQRQQMASYIQLQILEKPNGDVEYGNYMNMTIAVNKALGGRADLDILEGCVLETWMACYEKQKNYVPAMFIRDVKTRYIRLSYASKGLTSTGEKYKYQPRITYHSVTNSNGENLLDSVDQDGKLPGWFADSQQTNGNWYSHEEESYEEE